jgi:hypothetical protein
LNSRQQESYNFQKVSAVLADYGYTTIRLSSDWKGADFIAQHFDGTFLKVQLKGRLTFEKKYEGQDIHICFRAGQKWYLYPHDVLLPNILLIANIQATYLKLGGYNFPTLSKRLITLLEPYYLA